MSVKCYPGQRRIKAPQGETYQYPIASKRKRKTKFKNCYLRDLHNHDHDPNMRTKGPVRKLYTKFLFDSCKTF